MGKGSNAVASRRTHSAFNSASIDCAAIAKRDVSAAAAAASSKVAVSDVRISAALSSCPLPMRVQTYKEVCSLIRKSRTIILLRRRHRTPHPSPGRDYSRRLALTSSLVHAVRCGTGARSSFRQMWISFAAAPSQREEEMEVRCCHRAHKRPV